jgi:AbrB family transcriptional regulator (stage V sporulation protein T)
MIRATGIVRRIDDLGRIVIPKEVRRKFKIREGEPMEIFVTDEGILFKKYSPVAQLHDFAKEYADSLYESTDHIALITDRDTIIAVSGGSRRNYLDKNVGDVVLQCFENRKSVLNNNQMRVEILDDVVEDHVSYVTTPIFVGSDSIGSVILINKDENIKMGQLELKLVETAASFLAKQMEE